MVLLPPSKSLGRAADEDGGTTYVFEPGHEEAVEALLAPYSSDDLVLEGYGLQGLHPGPACALTFIFASLDDGEVNFEVCVYPDEEDGEDAGGSFSFEYVMSLSRSIAPGAFRVAFEALLARNDPGGFFESRCTVVEDNSFENSSDEDADRTLDMLASSLNQPRSIFLNGLWFVVLRILLSIGAALFAILVLRRWTRAERLAGRAADASPVAGTWWLRAVIVAALSLRLVLLFFAYPDPMETEHFPDSASLRNFTNGLAFLQPWGTLGIAKGYHMPLLKLALTPWFELGDALGVGGRLFWLRLPALALSGWFMVLLVRLGRWLKTPAAGRGAALLFAFVPSFIELSIHMGHYFAEMVVATWFLERLASVARAGRPHWASLAVSAAAALWTGSISGLVVVPGLLVLLGLSFTGGRRRLALAAALLFLALYAPVMETAFDQFMSYSNVSVAETVSDGEMARLGLFYQHGALDVEDSTLVGFLSFPWDLAAHLFTPLPAAACLLGLLLLLLRRPLDAVPPLLFLAIYAVADTRIYLSPHNCSPIFALFLLLPIWGFSSAGRVLSARPLRVAQRRVILVLVLVLGMTARWAPYSRSYAEVMAQWVLEGQHSDALTTHLSRDEVSETPLLVIAHEYNSAYPFCEDRSSRLSLEDCEDEWEISAESAEPPMVRYTLHGRPFVIGCTGGGICSELLSEPPWSDGPFLVLTSFENLREAEDLRRVGDPISGPVDYDACVLELEIPSALLFSCPPYRASRRGS